MAQVTNPVSPGTNKVEISPDGTTWTIISGAVITFAVSGGGKITGETYTLDGDNPLVTVGKNTPTEITSEFVYTEGAADAFEVLRPLFAAASAVYVRWSPKGGTTGNFQFTTTAGRLTGFNHPGADASSGDPVRSGFTWRGPTPVKSVVA